MESVIANINLTGEALTDWAVMSLLTTSVIAFLLLMVESLMQDRLSHRWRFVLVCIVFIQLIVVPGLLSVPVMGGWSGTHHAVQAKLLSSPSLPEALGHPNQAGTDQLILSPQSRVLSTAGWLFVAWSGTVTLLIGWTVLRVMRGYAKIRKAHTGNRFFKDILAYCCEQMKVKTPVQLKVSSHQTKTGVAGIIEPVIVIPEDLGPRFGSRHIRMAIMRQLAQIQQSVPWWSWLVWLGQVTYFFNPLVWSARKRFQVLAEACADETVQETMESMVAKYPSMLDEIKALEDVGDESPSWLQCLEPSLSLAG